MQTIEEWHEENHATKNTLGITRGAASFLTRCLLRMEKGKAPPEFEEYALRFNEKDLEYITSRLEAFYQQDQTRKTLCRYCHFYHYSVIAYYIEEIQLHLSDICELCAKEEKERRLAALHTYNVSNNDEQVGTITITDTRSSTKIMTENIYGEIE